MEKYKQEVHNLYMDYYAPGFANGDMDMINKVVKYPIAYIQNGSVSMHNEYPIDPRELKAKKGWDHTSDWKFEVTSADEKEARAIASSIRRREDGSVIEHVDAFYAFTRTREGWKMYAVSDLTFLP